ncbi:T9SS type A sorting domain-containing protein [Frigoriflavimonas asaccharolytica]|uniref:Alpha-tubulin suppressor-like RCC1 family protein n=1 Tax=Frigoriflavimonas asaccharolytica TaxID=2735899 RepID=A0A8J8GD51_9FLAO|nr:T9SS type A sorting domain-containing protein [Frigoriflavimonas asaccharolytica]NRS94049.1 alpha-tubulin suppressor-like RCC1 family protein [Frigoriflavimonas asaccharolytica]
MEKNYFHFKNKLSATLLLAAFLLFSFTNVKAQCSTTGWVKIEKGLYHSVALKSDGTIWMWGLNTQGLLGNGSAAQTVVKNPTQIGTDTDWTDISSGCIFVLAKKSNGTLYGWGDNGYGNFGLGNNTDLSTPTQLFGGATVKSFFAGYYHSMVVKTDGTMWGAGYNAWGNIGNGNTTGSHNTWKQETSLATDWEKTAAGWYNSFGIKSDGTLWSCGTNVEGQTGTGASGSPSSSFVKIGTDTDWADVSCGVYHVLGLKTTGKLFGWGASHNGRLGIVGAGAQYFRSPQAIEAASNFSAIGAGFDNSFILKTDGKMFSMGVNDSGMLGTGAAGGDTNSLAPQQVGTDSDWAVICRTHGENMAGAIKTNTTMWNWGSDSNYQLGNDNGVAANQSLPSQVVCASTLSSNDVVAQKSTSSIYPNPAKENITVQSQQKISKIRIYNIAGSLIKNFSFGNDYKVNINVSDLTTGVYIVKINEENTGIKLIKK